SIDLDLMETSCALSFAAPGTYAVAASYAGDGNYGASASGDSSHVVLPVPTTTVISAQSINPTAVGQDYDVTVTVTAADMSVPTGMVSIASDVGESCGPVAVDMSGQASCTLGSPSAGTRNLTASFVADSPWADSDSGAADTHTVNAIGTSITIDSNAPDPSVVGQSYSVAFTVSADSGVAEGTVLVSDGEGGSCNLMLTL